MFITMERTNMSKDTKIIKPLTIALGATFAASLAASNIATAAQTNADNPFAMNDLNSGYMQVADSHKEGKCGEGKCGEGKKANAKDKEGKCGEGKCGEGKCGDDKKAKKKEGKCGEGKCGAK